MFDPTWFTVPGVDLAEKLKAQRDFKNDPRLIPTTEAYLDFLDMGGQILHGPAAVRNLS